MKQQTFQKIDDFKPEEWCPIDDKGFHFNVRERFGGQFWFDPEAGYWSGRIWEEFYIQFPKDSLPDRKWYFNARATIIKKFKEWGLEPYRVTWMALPDQFSHSHDFNSLLTYTLEPQPLMYYKATEDDENCFVDSTFRIEKWSYAIEVGWRHSIYNDETDPNNLWKKFVEVMKRRVHEPFTATLGTREELTVE